VFILKSSSDAGQKDVTLKFVVDHQMTAERPSVSLYDSDARPAGFFIAIVGREKINTQPAQQMSGPTHH